MLHRQHTTWREEPDRSVVRAYCGYRRIRFALQLVPDLFVTEEKVDARFHHVLENEIFVIIAGLENIGVDKVIEGGFPFRSHFCCLSVIVKVFLTNFGIQDLLVYPCSQRGWHSPLGELYQEGLVVFLQKPFADHDSLVDKTFFFVNSDLSE